MARGQAAKENLEAQFASERLRGEEEVASLKLAMAQLETLKDNLEIQLAKSQQQAKEQADGYIPLRTQTHTHTHTHTHTVIFRHILSHGTQCILCGTSSQPSFPLARPPTPVHEHPVTQ